MPDAEGVENPIEPPMESVLPTSFEPASIIRAQLQDAKPAHEMVEQAIPASTPEGESHWEHRLKGSTFYVEAVLSASLEGPVTCNHPTAEAGYETPVQLPQIHHPTLVDIGTTVIDSHNADIIASLRPTTTLPAETHVKSSLENEEDALKEMADNIADMRAAGLVDGLSAAENIKTASDLQTQMRTSWTKANDFGIYHENRVAGEPYVIDPQDQDLTELAQQQHQVGFVVGSMLATLDRVVSKYGDDLKPTDLAQLRIYTKALNDLTEDFEPSRREAIREALQKALKESHYNIQAIFAEQGFGKEREQVPLPEYLEEGIREAEQSLAVEALQNDIVADGPCLIAGSSWDSKQKPYRSIIEQIKDPSPLSENIQDPVGEAARAAVAELAEVSLLKQLMQESYGQQPDADPDAPRITPDDYVTATRIIREAGLETSTQIKAMQEVATDPTITFEQKRAVFQLQVARLHLMGNNQGYVLFKKLLSYAEESSPPLMTPSEALHIRNICLITVHEANKSLDESLHQAPDNRRRTINGLLFLDIVGSDARNQEGMGRYSQRSTTETVFGDKAVFPVYYADTIKSGQLGHKTVDALYSNPGHQVYEGDSFKLYTADTTGQVQEMYEKITKQVSAELTKPLQALMDAQQAKSIAEADTEIKVRIGSTDPVGTETVRIGQHNLAEYRRVITGLGLPASLMHEEPKQDSLTQLSTIRGLINLANAIEPSPEHIGGKRLKIFGKTFGGPKWEDERDSMMPVAKNYILRLGLNGRYNEDAVKQLQDTVDLQDFRRVLTSLCTSVYTRRLNAILEHRVPSGEEIAVMRDEFLKKVFPDEIEQSTAPQVMHGNLQEYDGSINVPREYRLEPDTPSASSLQGIRRDAAVVNAAIQRTIGILRRVDDTGQQDTITRLESQFISEGDLAGNMAERIDQFNKYIRERAGETKGDIPAAYTAFLD